MTTTETQENDCRRCGRAIEDDLKEQGYVICSTCKFYRSIRPQYIMWQVAAREHRRKNMKGDELVLTEEGKHD